MVEREDQAVNTTTTSPLLQMQRVSFGYRGQTLLYEVSLSVQAGEMIGLLGPNGSGKTTLLRLLSGVLRPQQGHVLLKGRDLRQWGRRGVAQHIAVVPQGLHMPFDFTVEHMVSLGRTPFAVSFWRTRGPQDRVLVEDAMVAAGVSTLAERVFNELSGGERQRVMIAMALAQQPAVLLLDEPTSHLDIKYQIETLELVQALNRERAMTIVAAMHDLNLASRYFSRLVLFQRGIVADASPTEVLEPGLLRRVYGINVQVGILRGAEHLSVLPPSRDAVSAEDEPGPATLVHIIAGGGSGELMMRALTDARIPFSAGALNIGDSDHALALRLAKEVITEQPYSPISQAALAQVRTCLAAVKVLIICPTAIGPGNLVLLQVAVQAAEKGLPVILLVSPVGTACAPDDLSTQVANSVQLFGARDYTQGQGLVLLEQLIAAGAHMSESVGEALEEAKKYIGTLLYNTL